MKSIFRTILLGTLVTLAPAPAWAQLPLLDYTHDAGAVTDISGALWNSAGCTPGAFFGWPRVTGGDGVWATLDANPINSGGHTEMSYAAANARGDARAFVTVDTSSPCIVNTPASDSIYRGADGQTHALFYRRYTVGGLPPTPRMYLNWNVQGSFSDVTPTSWNGFANFRIFLLPEPPPVPVSSPVSINGSVTLAWGNLYSRTAGVPFQNGVYCFLQTCTQPPQAPVINTDGTVDALAAFQAATGRPLRVGDSFIIVALLDVYAQSCGSIPGCAVSRFTSDFSVSTRFKTDVEFIP